MIRTKTRAIRHKQFWRQRTRVPSLRRTKSGEENRNRYARSPFRHLMIPPSAKASRDHSSFIQIFRPSRRAGGFPRATSVPAPDRRVAGGPQSAPPPAARQERGSQNCRSALAHLSRRNAPRRATPCAASHRNDRGWFLFTIHRAFMFLVWRGGFGRRGFWRPCASRRRARRAPLPGGGRAQDRRRHTR